MTAEPNPWSEPKQQWLTQKQIVSHPLIGRCPAAKEENHLTHNQSNFDCPVSFTVPYHHNGHLHTGSPGSCHPSGQNDIAGFWSKSTHS